MLPAVPTLALLARGHKSPNRMARLAITGRSSQGSHVIFLIFDCSGTKIMYNYRKFQKIYQQVSSLHSHLEYWNNGMMACPGATTVKTAASGELDYQLFIRRTLY
jgi:hypothetical protein